MTDDLTTIPGVGETIAQNLRDVGFESVDEVLNADVDELTEVGRIGEQTAEAILAGEVAGFNGRPSRLGEVWDDVMDAAERGLTYEGIARSAGIGRSTLDEWREDHEEFNRELERHRSRGEHRLVDRVAEEKPEFILERSYDYIKTEKREIEGEYEHRIEGEGFVVEFGDEE